MYKKFLPSPEGKEKGFFFFFFNFQSTWNGTPGILLESGCLRRGQLQGSYSQGALPGGASPELGAEYTCKTGTSSRPGCTGLAGPILQLKIGAMFCLQDTSGAQLWAAKCPKYSLKTIRYSLPSFREPPQSQEYWGSDTFVVAQHPGRKAVCLNA